MKPELIEYTDAPVKKRLLWGDWEQYGPIALREKSPRQLAMERQAAARTRFYDDWCVYCFALMVDAVLVEGGAWVKTGANRYRYMATRFATAAAAARLAEIKAQAR